jgi:hypothetical protein
MKSFLTKVTSFLRKEWFLFLAVAVIAIIFFLFEGL